MRVLWFEVTEPPKYRNRGMVIGGWQAALEEIVKQYGKDIELYVAFETNSAADQVKVVEGVTYLPIYNSYSWWERLQSAWTWAINERKLIPKCVELIGLYSPDLIHVFGNEWPFGLVALHTTIPVVVHIQGAIVPYNNAMYPPRYNGYTIWKSHRWNLKKALWQYWEYHKNMSREDMEYRVWNAVSNYMGRTVWDYAVANVLHPSNQYFHVEEALRPTFLTTTMHWKYIVSPTIKLFSTGCSSFWKGPDMMLKTAHCLKRMGVNFEWQVAGYMPDNVRKVVEMKEKMTFSENHIHFLGFIQPDLLCEKLCSSTLYVHTAYIENSPNSICEAQYLGVPIVSTHVGGISTLLHDGKDGMLVPANDPWQMANAIAQLVEDHSRMIRYSVEGMAEARKRHNPELIFMQLSNCYKSLCK